MADATGARFSCDSCGKTYAWKQELAGRRVKCKCGSVMTVPADVAEPEPALEDLYDLAPTSVDENQPMRQTVMPVAQVAQNTPSPAAPKKKRGGLPAVPGRSAAGVLGYQTGPTQRERDRMSNATLVDMKRDLYAPIALLVIGVIMCVVYTGIKVGGAGSGVVLLVSLLLAGVFALQAALLIVFAFVVAGPMGVSFGGVWTATLKFAAISVFGAVFLTYVEWGVEAMTGARGWGGSYISFPISLGMYWLLLIWLFDMDPSDSWTCVGLLWVFNMACKLVLGFLLVYLLMNHGGALANAAMKVIAFGGGGGGRPAAMVAPANPTIAQTNAEFAQRVEELEDSQSLKEAKEYIAGGRQNIMRAHVDAWYEAGAPKVWFTVERDINGRTEPYGLIVEMPEDKEARAKCLEIFKAYYTQAGFEIDPDEMKDVGQQYLDVNLQ